MNGEATQLHRDAMALADEAYDARRRGDSDSARSLLDRAFEKERGAAELMQQSALEPSRSTLFKSAASLALQVARLRDAERLVAIALGGDPPADLADELRDLLEQINFERHLDLRGVDLEENEFQLSLSGNSVGFGVADSREFVSRVEVVQKLVYRTAERRRGQQYRDKGAPTDLFTRDLEVFMSVPRAASFAVTLRLGAPEQLPLPGSAHSTFIRETIDELLECLQIFDEANVSKLHQKIPEAAYYRNFVALAKTFAPDGNNVKVVGLTSSRPKMVTKVLLKTPRLKTPRAVSAASSSASVSIKGTLKFADSTRDTGQIQLVDESGKKHKIVVPEGMMADIVRPMWDTVVVVSGTKTFRGISLEDIVPAQA
jgi:hypothetical protein